MITNKTEAVVGWDKLLALFDVQGDGVEHCGMNYIVLCPDASCSTPDVFYTATYENPVVINGTKDGTNFGN